MHALFSIACLVAALFFGIVLRRAYLNRRIAYANVFGRTLYANLNTSPIGFWIAFGFGVFLCVGLLSLAIEGPDRFVS
jgi:tetrahydromethanopterin S-methyltransferase subunit E